MWNMPTNRLPTQWIIFLGPQETQTTPTDCQRNIPVDNQWSQLYAPQ